MKKDVINYEFTLVLKDGVDRSYCWRIIKEMFESTFSKDNIFCSWTPEKSAANELVQGSLKAEPKTQHRLYLKLRANPCVDPFMKGNNPIHRVY